MKLAPFFKGFGAKHRNARHYPAPLHNVIIEPFAHSAGYACHHHEGREVLLIDANQDVIALWQWLIVASADEILATPCPPYGQLWHEVEWPSPQAKLLAYSCAKSWGVAKARDLMRSKVFCGVRMEKHNDTSFWGPKFRARTASQVKHIRHWRAVCGDYSIAPDVKAAWFVDPPYQDARLQIYPGVPLMDHSKLAEWCKSRKGQVIACDLSHATWLDFTAIAGIKPRPGARKSMGCNGPIVTEATWTK